MCVREGDVHLRVTESDKEKKKVKWEVGRDGEGVQGRSGARVSGQRKAD